MKDRYDDKHSEIVNRIMKDADRLLNEEWDALLSKFKVDHPYKLSNDDYSKCCNKVREKLVEFMKHGEREFIEGTVKDDCYPQGCMHRANRSFALWERWDMKYKVLIPSWKIYSSII